MSTRRRQWGCDEDWVVYENAHLHEHHESTERVEGIRRRAGDAGAKGRTLTTEVYGSESRSLTRRRKLPAGCKNSAGEGRAALWAALWAPQRVSEGGHDSCLTEVDIRSYVAPAGPSQHCLAAIAKWRAIVLPDEARIGT
eukprot:scaffold26965_cov106-Isochrysis_galbana.AAC.6